VSIPSQRGPSALPGAGVGSGGYVVGSRAKKALAEHFPAFSSQSCSQIFGQLLERGFDPLPNLCEIMILPHYSAVSSCLLSLNSDMLGLGGAIRRRYRPRTSACRLPRCADTMHPPRLRRHQPKSDHRPRRQARPQSTARPRCRVARPLPMPAVVAANPAHMVYRVTAGALRIFAVGTASVPRGSKASAFVYRGRAVEDKNRLILALAG
jgi:hypothetical protein